MVTKTAMVMQRGVRCPECGMRNFPTNKPLEDDKCLFCGFLYQVPVYYMPPMKEE